MPLSLLEKELTAVDNLIEKNPFGNQIICYFINCSFHYIFKLQPLNLSDFSDTNSDITIQHAPLRWEPCSLVLNCILLKLNLPITDELTGKLYNPNLSLRHDLIKSNPGCLVTSEPSVL